MRCHITIHILYHTLVHHLVKLGVYGVYQLLVMAHVAVFSWSKRKVFCFQIIEFVLGYHIFGLVAIAYHSIIIASSQIFHGLCQVVDYHYLSATFLQRVNHGPTLHQGNLLAFHISQSIVLSLALACHYLVVQSQHRSRVVHVTTTIGRVNHHSQIHLSLHHVASNSRPFVRFERHRYVQALHQSLGKLHVHTAWVSCFVNVFQWWIILVDTKKQWFFVGIA